MEGNGPLRLATRRALSGQLRVQRRHIVKGERLLDQIQKENVKKVIDKNALHAKAKKIQAMYH